MNKKCYIHVYVFLFIFTCICIEIYWNLLFFYSNTGNKFELLEISTKNLFAQPKDLSEIGEGFVHIICIDICT
jgi:hypothetical protein